MKKVIACICCVLWFFFASTALCDSISKKEWISSADDVIKVHLDSVDLKNYPKADVSLSYVIDTGEQRRGTWTHDASSVIGQYVSQHPEYKNRKVPLSVKLKEVVNYRGGVQYTFKLDLLINDTIVDTMRLGINLSEEFPDIFVDYEVLHIVEAIKKIKENLYDVASFKLNGDAYMTYGEDGIIYYYVPYAAKNRMGGYVTSEAGIVYNENNGLFNIIDMDDFSYLFNGGAHPGVSIYDEWSNIYCRNYQIWQRLIEENMQ